MLRGDGCSSLDLGFFGVRCRIGDRQRFCPKEIDLLIRKGVPMKGLCRIAVALAGLGCLAGTGYTETTIDDNITPSGSIQQVIGVKGRDGRWMQPNAPILIGLAPIPGASGRGFDRMKMVIDLAKVAPSVPAGCGIRLEAPWKILRTRFPMPDMVDADLFAVPEFRKRSDGTEYQELSWRQGGCGVAARFAHPDRGDARQLSSAYPGLAVGSTKRAVQVVWLALQASSGKMSYTMAVPYVAAKFSPRN